MEQRQTIGGNTSTGTLKILALAFMFADHAGKMLLPGVPEMRTLGRLAFPLYCWCLVVGFHYTRSVPKYLLRLLIVGAISQPLYMWTLNHTWRQPNIFLTLLIGLAALWGIRERWLASHIWAPVIALLLAVQLGCDYGWRGVLLILLLHAARESKASVAAVMIAFCLYWGSNSASISSFFGHEIRLTAPFSTLLQPWLRQQAFAICALPLMLIQLPNIKMPPWLGYALYPMHLVVLLILEQIVA